MIDKVVAQVNEAVQQTALADFYDRRARLKSTRAHSRPLLDFVKSDGGALDGYAFHRGGRSEIQFNVGFEEGPSFRYGVAFSLEASRTLTDPVGTFLPKIQRFNRSLDRFPVLNGLRMWSYEMEGRSEDSVVRAIPESKVREGNFFFVGERVDLGPAGVTPVMIERAASVMASLLPLYEHIEQPAEAPSEFKVARLCWNTELWERPSGWQGKSSNARAFESEHGYGHEEWLFDRSRLIGGWKYGFIQALNHSHAKYAGTPLNLLLYTINSRTKTRYWVGTIRNLHVLTYAEALQGQRHFEKKGWLREMAHQVKALAMDAGSLSVDNPIELVNVRYRPEDLTLFEPPIQFDADELPSAYYGTLQQVPPTQLAVAQGRDRAEEIAERNIHKLNSKRSAYWAEREISLEHKRWQKELRKNLPDLLDAEVLVEADMGGRLVDLVIRKNGRTVFAELKTTSSARRAIREALSQLMEYAYAPPTRHRADALLIVSAGIASQEDLEYLDILRERFAIPVSYLPYRDGTIPGLLALVDAL